MHKLKQNRSKTEWFWRQANIDFYYLNKKFLFLLFVKTQETPDVISSRDYG